MRITYRMRLGGIQLLYATLISLYVLCVVVATFGPRGFDAHGIRRFSGLVLEFGVITLLFCAISAQPYIIYEDGCLTIRKRLLAKPFKVRVEDIRFIERKSFGWKIQTDSKSFLLPDGLENLDDLVARITSVEEPYSMPPVAYPRRRVGQWNG